MEDALTDAAIPRRPAGVEPDGRLRGSGFAEQQWLVRRDNQFVQVSELLYRVVELADGSRTLEEIADELTASTQWEVTPKDVELIIKARLGPLGLVADEDAEDRSRRAGPPSPLLSNARLRVIGPRAIDRLASVLQELYRPPLLVAALVVAAISQFWLFARGDPSSAIQQVVATPLSLPLIAGLLVVAGVFHEFGHAAALRYGGGRARGMGVGLYLFIPVFYTDVTESYRLKRHARVRTDLGGLYFHLIGAAAFIAAGAATGNEFFLVAAFLIDLDVARQLIPFIRLDGYWLLADLTGIPDLFAHAGPRLQRRLSKNGNGPAPAPLRRGVRHIFIAYTLLAVPAIVGLMGYVGWHAPSVFDRTLAAVSARVDIVDVTVARGDWGNALLALLEIVLLALPTVGLVFFFAVLVRAVARLALRRAAATGPAADVEAATRPAAPVEPASAAVSSHSRRPSTPRAGEPISLQAAIEDHLELKSRHAEEARPAARAAQQLSAV
jgi:putative peptide zinc metalloprotease protein